MTLPHILAKRPCKRCGSYERYASNRQCPTCARKKNNGRQKNPQIRLHRAFRKAKQRANERGLPFTIVLDDLSVPDVCPVLGIPMDVPSLDQHDPGKGYTPDNTRVISWRANDLKSNGTLDEFEKLVAYLRL